MQADLLLKVYVIEEIHKSTYMFEDVNEKQVNNVYKNCLIIIWWKVLTIKENMFYQSCGIAMREDP